MGAMSPKFASIATHHASVQQSLLATIIPLLGTPHDGLKANIYGDKNTQIIKPSEVAVGDLAYSGGVCGTVTAILNDGEGSPTDNRIAVTWNTPYMQTPAATNVADRTVEYNFVDNDEADGNDILEDPVGIRGSGIVFVRNLNA